MVFRNLVENGRLSMVDHFGGWMGWIVGACSGVKGFFNGLLNLVQ
jgi:hypothetical protein